MKTFVPALIFATFSLYSYSEDKGNTIPDLEYPTPKLKYRMDYCKSVKYSKTETNWAIIKFKLNDYGKPVALSVEKRFPQSVGEYCYKKAFKDWRFELPEDHTPDSQYEYLITTKLKKR